MNSRARLLVFLTALTTQQDILLDMLRKAVGDTPHHSLPQAPAHPAAVGAGTSVVTTAPGA